MTEQENKIKNNNHTQAKYTIDNPKRSETKTNIQTKSKRKTKKEKRKKQGRGESIITLVGKTG